MINIHIKTQNNELQFAFSLIQYLITLDWINITNDFIPNLL